jgi:type IV pilus assembly protein PilV
MLMRPVLSSSMPDRHIGRGERGFLIIEALIAILIFSLGVIALMGLQSISVGNALHGKYRTDASYLANAIVAQMMVDKNNVSGYIDGAGSPAPRRADWDADVAAALPNGNASITMNGTAVTVVLSWRNPDEISDHNYTAVAQVVF